MSQRIDKALQCMTKEITEALHALKDSTPVVGNAVCVTIDGDPAYASPVRTYDTETGTMSASVTWVNPDTLAPLAGTIAVADPCDCPCLECPDP